MDGDRVFEKFVQRKRFLPWIFLSVVSLSPEIIFSGILKMGLSPVRSKPGLAHAQDTPREPLSGPWLFLSTSVGPQLLSTAFPNESSKRGYAFTLGGKFSYYEPSLLFDLGLSYYNSKLIGTDERETTVNTRSGLIEAGLGLRFSQGLSLGPVGKIAFGSDNSYAEFVDSTNPTAFFAGLAFLADFPSSSGLSAFRIGVNFATDLNIVNRQIWKAMLTLDFGLSFSKNPESSPTPVSKKQEEEEVAFLPEDPVALLKEPEPEPPPPSQPEPETPLPPRETVATVISETAVLVRLPNDKFLFDTGMSHLNRNRKAYVNEIGAFLGGNPSLWERAEITGHTDIRGSRRVNEELSEARAQSVYLALIEGGAPAEKMVYAGKAFDEPVDPTNTPEAWAKNRRTELKFLGVTDPESFSQVINQLDSKYR